MTPDQRVEAYKARAQAALEGTGPAQPVSFTKIECKLYLKTADWVEGMGLTSKDLQRAQQLGEALGKQLHEREMARLNDYVSYTSNNTWDWGPRYDGTYRYSDQYTFKLTPPQQSEEDDMAKTTPRTLYQFAVVDKKDDSIDIQVLVGETEQDARDELIRNPNVFPDNRRPKEFDIVVLMAKPLSPKVEK